MSATETMESPFGTAREPVAILGATGAVGQTFVRLLADHPWFRVAEVAASERSAGKTYRDATRWLEGTIPDTAAALTVSECTPDAVRSRVVFSALDSSVAGDVEEAFARAGRVVLSNAKNHRMGDDVPLVIPEVNAGHLSVLTRQRQARGWAGALVTNANCAATVAALALAPLHETFTLTSLFISTMQAVSGAGYPGVPSLDILANVIPYIADEEPKLEAEIGKLLGDVRDGTIQHARVTVSAHTSRVPVENGHTVCMTAGFSRPCTVGDAERAVREWQGCSEAIGLPSRPARPVVLATAPDRPQPRRDVDAGDGMTVTVGRIRADSLLQLRLVAMGHNTIRGAAGGSVLNAELLASQGLLDGA